MTGPDPVPRFDRAAASYDGAARAQREIAGELLGLLRGLPTPAAVLEAGCGTGQLTGQLIARFPRSRIDAFDAAPRMVAEARRRLAPGPLVTLFSADMRRLRRRGRYDLVLSNCALHWLHPMGPALRRLAAAMRPGGRLAAAVMTEGTLAELHEARRRAAPAKAPSPLPPADLVEAEFRRAGLRILERREVGRRTLHPGPESLLEALRAMGVTGGRFSRGPVPLNRRELDALLRGYRAAHGAADGSVPASWRAVLLLAGEGKGEMPPARKEAFPAGVRRPPRSSQGTREERTGAWSGGGAAGRAGA